MRDWGFADNCRTEPMVKDGSIVVGDKLNRGGIRFGVCWFH